MATLATLRTRVREHLGETTPGYFTNTEIDAWINEAQIQVAKKILGVDQTLLLTSGTLNWTADTAEYALPSSTWEVVHVERLNADGDIIDVPPLILIQDKHLYDKGNVQPFAMGALAYYLRGQNIGFVPTPSETQTAAVRVWYQPLPATLSADGTESDLPNDTEDLIALNAAYRGFARAGDIDRYRIYQEMYKRQLTEYVDSADVRVKTPRFVRSEGA